MRLENLGLIGNCQFSALVSRAGEVVWCCLPRFDSEPVFSTLLDERNGGRFTVGTPDGADGTQRYLGNTNVLETTFRTPSGSFRVIDFAPRLVQYERITRPTQLYRIVEPVEGTPQVRVVCEPRLGWSKAAPLVLPGSNHVRFEGFENPLRLTTDIPPSYLGGQPFVLTERRHLVLAWGAPVEEPLPGLCERFLHGTMRYWQQWIKHCNIPPMYQEEVIRSALALKLHCFEDTGAIIASVTTSIPEAPGSGRTWDYRYCWLRDAYYALDAFRMLGHFEERESFTNFLLNVAGGDPELTLKPIYRIDGTTDLEERSLDHFGDPHKRLLPVVVCRIFVRVGAEEGDATFYSVAAGFSLRWSMNPRENPHRLDRRLYRGRTICTFTCCVHDRLSLFSSDQVFSVFQQKLLTSLEQNHCVTPVYLFMPDHLHALVEGVNDQADLWKTIVDFKQQTGYWLSVNHYIERWQKDFFDHILRKDEDLTTQVNYILNNPVRAHLVDTWNEYSYKGSTVYDLNTLEL